MYGMESRCEDGNEHGDERERERRYGLRGRLKWGRRAQFFFF